jgi:Protein of unknown function (DUF2892).|nr:MAG: protein of unknown function, DUF2892 [Candidatus Nanosalinarum sp. J07AB56]
MEKNVGDSDAAIRILAGALLGTWSLAILKSMVPQALMLPEIASPVLGIVSLVLLFTGFNSTCYMYSLLGIDTS